MSIWYRQSSRPGFNLVPVGVKGTVIFVLNLLTFLIPINVLALSPIPGMPEIDPSYIQLSWVLVIASTLFFIYSLKYKADHTPHDQNQN